MDVAQSATRTNDRFWPISACRDRLKTTQSGRSSKKPLAHKVGDLQWVAIGAYVLNRFPYWASHLNT